MPFRPPPTQAQKQQYDDVKAAGHKVLQLIAVARKMILAMNAKTDEWSPLPVTKDNVEAVKAFVDVMMQEADAYFGFWDASNKRHPGVLRDAFSAYTAAYNHLCRSGTIFDSQVKLFDLHCCGLMACFNSLASMYKAVLETYTGSFVPTDRHRQIVEDGLSKIEEDAEDIKESLDKLEGDMETQLQSNRDWLEEQVEHRLPWS